VEKDGGKILEKPDRGVSEISAPVGFPQLNQDVSRRLLMAIKVQSLWTEYKKHRERIQTGDVITAYNRKMKEFETGC